MAIKTRGDVPGLFAVCSFWRDMVSFLVVGVRFNACAEVHIGQSVRGLNGSTVRGSPLPA
jgi:hypothetical protein